MTDKAEVSLQNVLSTLRGNGVTVTEKAVDGKTCHILEKGGVLEEHFLPAEAGRRLLQYFQRHFGVPIHKFFNAPETIPEAPAKAAAAGMRLVKPVPVSTPPTDKAC